MQNHDSVPNTFVPASKGNTVLAVIQALLLLVGAVLMLTPSLATAAVTGYLFTDADEGGPTDSIRPLGTSDVIYRYDVATDTVSVELRPAVFLTPAGKRGGIEVHSVHASFDSDSIYFSILGEATLADGTLVTQGDLLIYNRISQQLSFHEGIRALGFEAKGIDAVYVFESGPEAGKVLLSLRQNGAFSYPNPNTGPYPECGNDGLGATCSFNSRGQDVIEYDPLLKHPTIRFNAGTGILVDAVHLTDDGAIAISCEARKCSIGGTTFDENDLIELTLDETGSAVSGVAVRPDLGSLYPDPTINIDGATIYGSFIPEVDHFTIVKDPNESPSACSPATITISAVDADGNLVTDYSGTIQLSTSTGQGIWSIAGVTALTTDTTTKTGETTFLGTAPTTDTTVATSDAGDGTATYTFNGAADGDGGVIVLTLSHPESPLVDINVTDGGTTPVTERSGTGPTIGADEHVVFAPCTSVLGADHFVIEHAGQGINCSPSSVTIRAADASGNTITSYDGTISLSTRTSSTSNGTWSITADGGAGVFAAGANDSGLAEYTFVAEDQGLVTLQFAYLEQGTVDINVTDGAISEKSNLATLQDDPALTFVSAGLRFCEAGNAACNPISTQISGKRSDIAPSRGPLYVQAVGTATDGSCKALCSGEVEVQMSYECVDPNTCAGPALAVNDTRVTEKQLVVGGEFTRVTMNFGTGSDHAPFTMNYADAGKIRLYAKIPESATTPASCQTTLARSNDLVVRPFTFAFTNIQSGTTVNAEGTASSGEGFVPAGTPFEYQLTGRQWQAADDTDQNGHADRNANVFDNGLTPNFQAFTQSIALGVDTTTPTGPGAVVGAFGGPQAIAGTSVLNGTSSVSGQTYSEVGSLRINAELQGYLGARDGSVKGTSAEIGRFFPEKIYVNGSVNTTACGFAYMDEPAIDTIYSLRAVNTGNETTTNYDPARGYTFTGTMTAVLEDTDDGINRIGRTNIDVSTGFLWTEGQGTQAGMDQIFAKAGLPDGPFQNLQLGLILNEADNTPLIDAVSGAGVDMNADTSGACGVACNAKKVGSPFTVLYGRATLTGGYGPETADLALPATAEYFNGTSFVENDLDNCSVWTASQVSLGYGDLPAGTTSPSIANQPLAAGDSGLFLTAPGAGNTGNVFVNMDFASQPWFKYDWDGNPATMDTNPLQVEAIFSSKMRNVRGIYWREHIR